MQNSTAPQAGVLPISPAAPDTGREDVSPDRNSTTEAEANGSDTLLSFVAEVAGQDLLKVEEDLGAGFVRLNVSEAQARQAQHDIRCSEDILVELLRNARDADAHRIFIATSTEGTQRGLVVIDDGRGIPEALLTRVFEPRVTSKLTTLHVDEWGVHGRGMALYSIAQRSLESAVVAGGEDRGTAVRVLIDTQQLDERSDQSTWPKLRRTAEGGYELRSGPHNLLRHAIEFACTHPQLDLWFGSPNEILATLCAQEIPDEAAGEARQHWQLPAVAGDAFDLAGCASDLGLSVSERSAYRILRGEVPALQSLLTLAAARAGQARKTEGEPDLLLDRRGLKIDTRDLSEFSRQIEEAFDRLAEKYYLSAHDEPSIRLSRNELAIRFRFDKEY